MEYAQGGTSGAELTLQQIRTSAQKMSGWLKLLGIVYIVIGVPYLIILVGALYIWLGVLLFQAGDAASNGSDQELVLMTEKLKTYFIIMGVLLVLALALMVLVLAAVFVFGVFSGPDLFDQMGVLL